MNLLFLSLLTFLTFFAGMSGPDTCDAAETIEILSPARRVFAGQPLLFELSIRGIPRVGQAVVLYRPLGIRRYRKIVLRNRSGGVYGGSLKAQKVIPPGLEYFVLVTDQAGRVYTVPAENAEERPIRLDIALDETPPEVTGCTPENGETVESVTGGIRVRYMDRESGVDPDSIRVLLDGTDITSLCRIGATSLQYTPIRAVAAGPHTLTLTMADRFGNRIRPYSARFTCRVPGGKTNSSAILLVDAEGRTKILHGADNDEPVWDLQSSAGIDGTLDRGGFHHEFGGEGWYTQGDRRTVPDDPFTLSRIHYEMQYRNMVAAFGDVTVTGTDMTGSRILRRGSRTSVHVGRLSGEAFLLNSHQNTGFNDIIGGFDHRQRLVGGWLENRFLHGDALNLRATYISGRNEDPTGYNISTLEAGTEGSIFSMQLASTPFADDRLHLEGEFCLTDFDIDLSDDQGRISDSGWRLSAMGRREIYDWRLDYRNLGTEFHNIVRAIGPTGREEYRFQGGLRALSSTFHLTLQHSRDKVSDSAAMPVFNMTTAALAYSLNLPDFPQVFCNGSYTSQHSSREPPGFPSIGNIQYTLGGGFTLQRQTWLVSPNMTYIRMNDTQAGADNDSRTMVFSLVGSWFPSPWLSLTPSFFYSTTSSGAADVRYDTYQATLSGGLHGFSDRASLSTTLSYTENRADDASAHVTVWSAIAQLDWNLQVPVLEKVRKSIGIRGRYDETTDHVSGSGTEDWAVYLVVGVGIPIDLF